MDYIEKEYKVFELFHKKWALVTAGPIEDFNSCTVSWGSLGTIWTKPGKSGSIVTVYIYPTRYTRELLNKNETFTLSFYPEEYKKDLAILGSRSGRDEDKVKETRLTPERVKDAVTYREAELTFYCRKIYGYPFDKDSLSEDIKEYYKASPKVYPPDENGEFQTHWVFIGEILEAIEKTGE